MMRKTPCGDRLRVAAAIKLLTTVALSTALGGCGGGMFGSSDSSSTIGSRFSQIFGAGADSKAQLVGTPVNAQAETDPTCPGVAIRDGAATYAVGVPGKPAVAGDLRFQSTIISYARDCTRIAGQVNARIGVEGRVVVGPAGAPESVTLPIRVAVVQEGVQPKTIMTKLYTTPVDIGGRGNASFSFVAEDVAYPVPATGVADNYVFYIGFDPQGAKPERPAPKGKKG